MHYFIWKVELVATNFWMVVEFEMSAATNKYHNIGSYLTAPKDLENQRMNSVLFSVENELSNFGLKNTQKCEKY